MKFVHYIEKVTGVDIFGLSSLSIFFLFFLGVLIWMWKADKKKLEHDARMPLES